LEDFPSHALEPLVELRAVTDLQIIRRHRSAKENRLVVSRENFERFQAAVLFYKVGGSVGEQVQAN
jgi:hypothetical protein|tara:strand:+ start:397 stop:594 length:198 start_codon:yes stop_codon:yes gene_type:complete